jgi:hypothetical protein
MHEIAEPLEDQGIPCELHPLGDVGVMADDQVDALLLRSEPAPLLQLALVGHDALLEP